MWIAIFFVLFLTSLCSVASSEDSGKYSKQIRILENTKTDAPVADVYNLFELSSSASNFKLLKQKILRRKQIENDEERRKWFDLQSNSGLLKLRHPVDREELCIDVNPCTIRLEIFAADLRRILKLDVIVDDVNDNSPIFPHSRIVVNVSESAQVDDVITLNGYLAQDADLGLNGDLRYSITPNPYFGLRSYKDSSNTSQLLLYVKKKLDFETAPIQRMTLQARDQGNPPRIGEVDLVVKIADTNDNDPVFERKEYFATWPENLHVGYLIAQVRAFDADSENSGLLRYSLSRQNKKLASQLLRVDPVTGDVTLKETLDRELHDKLRVLIEARDSGSTNQRIGRTWLQLNVEDINDNFPQIDVEFLLPHEKNTVYLRENSEVNTYLAYVTAKDADLGRNGKTDVKLFFMKSENEVFESESEGTFILTDNGFLSLNKTADRETIDQYNLQLKACDFGIPSKCSTLTVTVQLLDVNDNRPTFVLTSLSLLLPEDTKVGSVLTRLVAFDNDTLRQPVLYQNENGEIFPSPYGDIMYHIIDGDGTLNIGFKSGQITLAHPLDRERTDRLKVTVRARDDGHTSALQSMCKVYVTIADVNDNKPFFITPQYDNVTYYTTILRDDVILQVKAVDYDLGENGTVSYEILSEDNMKKNMSLFVIDFDGGDLKLNYGNPNLNHSLGRHRIVVEARDHGALPLRDVRIIDVIITDLEELPQPRDISPSMTSSQSLMIIVSCAVASFVIMLGILLLAFWKCWYKTKHSASKKNIKNSCRNNSVKADVNSENKSVNVARNSKLSKDEVNSSNRQDYTLESSTTNLHSKENRLDNNAPKLLQFPEQYQQKFPRNYIALSMTSHDGDSGRGDSDPDAPGSDVIHDNVHHSRATSPELLNNHCTEQCLTHGHSDACWMPKLARETGMPRTATTHYQRCAGSSMYVELCPTPTPVCYNPYYNGRIIREVAHNSRRVQRWNFPANELSSIYSDVVMNQQKRAGLPHRYNPHLYPTTEINSPRQSPASCLSSPTYLPRYDELSTKNSNLIQRKTLVRSASEDHLKTSSALLSSLTQDSSHIEENSQNLSMNDTRDIVHNIDKLLD